MNQYDPNNPANPINQFNPNNPFNPINRYRSENALNPINKYNPNTPFASEGFKAFRREIGARKNGERIMSKVRQKATFKTETQEGAFWASYDSSEYIDYSQSRRVVFTRLKPSAETISLRLPKSLLDQLKTLANKRAVPYQTLLKLYALERAQAELHLKTAKAS